MTLETVSCRPSEIATPVTPRAVTKAVGWMLKTGSSTERSAMTHTVPRTRLMKIVATRSSILAVSRLTSTSSRWMTTTAIATAMPSVMALLARSESVAWSMAIPRS